MTNKRPLMRPSCIADLLSMLLGVAFDSEAVRCWPLREQAQAERWADMNVHRVVLVDLTGWRPGGIPKLPHCALRHAMNKASVNHNTPSVLRREPLLRQALASHESRGKVA